MSYTNTLTRADLAETMNRQVGLSRADSAVMVESILDHMIEALVDGENVKISGFGTFVTGLSLQVNGPVNRGS